MRLADDGRAGSAVGPHGAAVSGGERQLALAGAFLADPALLILEEPTAHLDPPTRRVLTADLLHATQDRSALFITQQPDGLDQVDHIVVLDQRRIAEQGTHQQLRHAGGAVPADVGQRTSAGAAMRVTRDDGSPGRRRVGHGPARCPFTPATP